MLPAFFIVLVFFVLFIFSRGFSIGLVLSSLLGIAWYFIGNTSWLTLLLWLVLLMAFMAYQLMKKMKQEV